MAYTIQEEQELNELKDWWKENGKVVIVAFVLAIAGVAGWRFWQSHQIQQRANASAEYDALIYSVNQNPQAQSQKVAEFVLDHNKTSYAVFALLDEAKNAVARQDFAQAEVVLKQAIEQSQDEVLSAIAGLRLSSVQFQLGQFDNALASLNQVKIDSFNVNKNLLAGDIQNAKGDKTAAKKSFETALKLATTPSEKQLSQMKLNNL